MATESDVIETLKKLKMKKLREKELVMPDLSPELEARLRKLLSKGKNKKDNNPGAVQSTKKLEKESNKKKIKESLKELAGGALGIVPMVGGSNTIKRPKPKEFEESDPIKKPKPKEFGAEEKAVKEPLQKKKGGEVKKKSKKSGRLALRGYGISR